MNVLAIETSCDETGIAVVEGKRNGDTFQFKTLGASLISQASLHAPYGGVYPNLAKREHEKNLPAILSEALKIAGFDHSLIRANSGIDAVAVTEGPGLEPALWAGITFVQELAKKWGLPLFGVNHMEGHLVSSLAQPVQHSNILQNVRMFEIRDLKFPVLALLISGGHTEFIVMHDWFRYERIGETLDDAVGECFDKVARMLSLPYPGGPEISRLATLVRTNAELTRKYAEKFKLPRPMLYTNNCDVSFSGLKTAALYTLRDIGGAEKLSAEEKAAFALEFENSITEVFLEKTRRALKESRAQTFVIGGGVAANTHIRQSLVALCAQEFPNIGVRLPELSITGDNAVMIAQAALLHLLQKDWDVEDKVKEIRAIGNLSITAKK